MIKVGKVKELLWKANRKSYAVYRMVLFPMTLSDLFKVTSWSSYFPTQNDVAASCGLLTTVVPSMTLTNKSGFKVTVPFDVGYRYFGHTGEADARSVGGSHLSCMASDKFCVVINNSNQCQSIGRH